jgi:predicted dehydrogenase
VGHVFLHNAAVQRVKQYLEEGALGRIYYISMVRTNLGPVRSDVNAAWDLAAHDISIASYWLQSQPLRASGVGGAWLKSDIEDAVFATLHYPDGVIVHLHTSWLNPRKSREITVVGDTRMLTLDDMSLTEPVRLYERGVDGLGGKPFIDTFASFHGGTRDGSIVIPRITVDEPLRQECDHFLDCIEKGHRPRPSSREAVAVVRALEAIETSVRGGGKPEAVKP